MRTGADRAEGRRVQNLYGKLRATVITLPPPTIRQRCVSASTRTGPPVKPLDPTLPLTPLDNPHGSPRTHWQVGRPVSHRSRRRRRVRQHSPITAHSYLGPVPHDTSYYAKCMLGGALACGFTHAGITPLDVTKCNMQVCSRLSQLQLVLASWHLRTFPDTPFFKYLPFLISCRDALATRGGGTCCWLCAVIRLSCAARYRRCNFDDAECIWRLLLSREVHARSYHTPDAEIMPFCRSLKMSCMAASLHVG